MEELTTNSRMFTTLAPAQRGWAPGENGRGLVVLPCGKGLAGVGRVGTPPAKLLRRDVDGDENGPAKPLVKDTDSGMELVMVGGGETKLGSARVAAERGVDAAAMDFAENDDGERSSANGDGGS
jgi:hypothetical protein